MITWINLRSNLLDSNRASRGSRADERALRGMRQRQLVRAVLLAGREAGRAWYCQERMLAGWAAGRLLGEQRTNEWHSTRSTYSMKRAGFSRRHQSKSPSNHLPTARLRNSVTLTNKLDWNLKKDKKKETNKKHALCNYVIWVDRLESKNRYSSWMLSSNCKIDHYCFFLMI